jgi:diguanylate cyclase (GGDEF)-like protein
VISQLSGLPRSTDTGETELSALQGEQLLGELFHLGIALSTEPDLSLLLEWIVTEARRFTRADAATLYLPEGAHLRFGVVQNEAMTLRLGEEEMKRRLDIEHLPLDIPSLAGYVALTGVVLNIPDAYAIPADQPYAFNWQIDVRTGYRTHSVLAVPLLDPSRRVLGVLQLINAMDDTHRIIPFGNELEDVARAFASYAAVAIRSARLEALSFKDPLTDAYNRRYLMQRLDEEAKRAVRGQQPLAFILFDLDRFKTINDRWGHEAGDEALKELVRVLASQSRRDTILARYGGDEFAVLLPNAARAAAVIYAERLQGVVARYPFRYQPLTASVGVASLPEDVTSGRALITYADRALAENKRRRRDGLFDRPPAATLSEIRTESRPVV